MINQRLLYQGKQLHNSENIKQYKIKNESVIHLLVRSAEDQSNMSQISNNEERNTIREEVPLISVRRNQRTRRRVPNFDASDCYESVHQNIQTIENIKICRNDFNEKQFKTIKPFDATKAQYEVGQWVDAKDTIDQWLEAQVVQIRDKFKDVKQALIHYNGWGSKWDEWIDFSSERIANFKTYTIQSPNSLFLSPNPNTYCDGSTEKLHRSIDVFYYLDKANRIMSELSKSIDYMAQIRRKESLNQQDDLKDSAFSKMETEILFFTTQIIPIMDRSGRLLSDLSLQLSHIILNPNIYPQLLLGHTNNTEVSDNMSCTSGYSMYTNESASLSGLTNNLRFLQDQNIVNNLQGSNNRTNMTNNQNSNQSIRNYNSTNNTNLNQLNTTSNNNYNQTNNTPTLPKYQITSSSTELPFIQRLHFANTLHPNYFSNTGNLEMFPKINLQIPPLLNPNEIKYVTAYNPLDEQNLFIFSRNVYVDQSIQSNNNTAQNSQLYPQRSQSYQIQRGYDNQANDAISNKGNINTYIEETKSDSEELSHTNTLNGNLSQLNNLNSNIAQNMNNNPFLIKSLQSRKTGSVKSGKSNLSADQMSAKQSRYTKRDDESQNDNPINLLGLNKENTYTENYMETISYKSDKNASIKNNHLSCRSVSEVNEFEESLEEENENKKANCTISSHHSHEKEYVDVDEFLQGEDSSINNQLDNKKSNNI